MTLDAMIQEDGTLIAKLPKAFSGKRVKITISAETTSHLSQWEHMSAMLQEIDELNLPQRTHEEILNELRVLKETT